MAAEEKLLGAQDTELELRASVEDLKRRAEEAEAKQEILANRVGTLEKELDAAEARATEATLHREEADRTLKQSLEAADVAMDSAMREKVSGIMLSTTRFHLSRPPFTSQMSQDSIIKSLRVDLHASREETARAHASALEGRKRLLARAGKAEQRGALYVLAMQLKEWTSRRAQSALSKWKAFAVGRTTAESWERALLLQASQMESAKKAALAAQQEADRAEKVCMLSTSPSKSIIVPIPRTRC